MASVPATSPATATSPAPATINPLLLVPACSGNRERLNILLNGELHEAARDDDLIPAYASFGTTTKSLLEGVTVKGNTALHAVATNGDDDNFLSSADLIYSKAEHLLFVQNKRGDTPLHLAARAGNYKMVSHLIDLAKEIVIGVSRPTTIAAARVKALLEAQNKLKETALHEAICIGSDKMVSLLMDEDPELATVPEKDTSPLYLAILLEKKIIAETLYEKSGGVLSYSGPNEQNALHAAVRRCPDLTRMMLKWNKDLTAQTDKNGSTPLHFAAEQVGRGSKSVCQQLVEANPAALYQSDHRDGLFPIHVAASVRAGSTTVVMFVKRCPGTAGLRDDKGRTFLHVAVEKKIVQVVCFACRYKLISWILNMRDENENTALHLAVREGSLLMVCSLLENLKVEMNLTNDEGYTPLDIAHQHIPPDGHIHPRNSEALVHDVLIRILGSIRTGPFHTGPFYENNKDRNSSRMIKETTAGLSIGSVLIATVTFGAAFALPGGYRNDAQEKEGTPTRAGIYSFDAFMVANTLSFVCSSIATIGFMFSGSPMVGLVTRKFYLSISVYLMHTSISSLAAAFALALYTVLAPVAPKTATAICVLSSLVALSSQMEIWAKRLLTLPPLVARNGLIWTIGWVAQLIIMQAIFLFWPIIFTFSWAAHS